MSALDSVLVWMLSMNREYNEKVCLFSVSQSPMSSRRRSYLCQEYDTIYQLVRLCFPNEKYKRERDNPDSFRMLSQTFSFDGYPNCLFVF